MSEAKKYAGISANKDRKPGQHKMDCINKRSLTTFLRYTIVPLIAGHVILLPITALVF